MQQAHDSDLPEVFITRTDATGHIRYANDAFLQASRFTTEELAAKSHNIVRHPDMPAWVFVDLWKTIQGGHPWRGLIKNKSKDGSAFWVHATITPMTLQGKITGYLSSGRKPLPQEIATAELRYGSGLIPLRRFSIVQWFGNLSLQLKIQPILFIILVGATVAVYYQSKSALMDNVQKRAESTATQVIDSANMLMVTGMISDASNRQLMIKKIIEGQRLKSLRLVRTEQVVKQFGPGLPEEHLDDPVIRSVIEDAVKKGQPIPRFSLETVEGKPIYRAITPYIESHDFHGTDCMNCHAVEVGSSNGASDMTIDLSDDFHRLHATVAYLALGQLVLQVFLYFFLGWITRRFVSGPVDEIKAHLHEIVDGDYSRPVDISRRDEMGELFCSVQSTKLLMGSIIDQICFTAVEIEREAAHLSEAVDDANKAVLAQDNASRSMASGISEISVSIDQVARNAEEVRRISVESNCAAVEGTQTVNQVISDMGLIGHEVAASADSVRVLRERSNEIAGVIKVIHEIAEQTNLLALNAAIEAARAGEHGRGFAVVADEVKKLATKTSESTRKITATITGINDGTHQAIHMIEMAVQKADQGKSLATAAGEAIVEIGNGSNKVREGVDDISASIHEQSAASRDIAANVEMIATMSDRTSAAVRNVSDTVKKMKSLSSALDASVGYFRI